MFTQAKIVFSAVMILGVIVPAAAATKHRTGRPHRPALYNIVPAVTAPDQPAQSGAPVRTAPDTW